jgi:hypothetical protein
MAEALMSKMAGGKLITSRVSDRVSIVAFSLDPETSCEDLQEQADSEAGRYRDKQITAALRRLHADLGNPDD